MPLSIQDVTFIGNLFVLPRSKRFALAVQIHRLNTIAALSAVTGSLGSGPANLVEMV